MSEDELDRKIRALLMELLEPVQARKRMLAAKRERLERQLKFFDQAHTLIEITGAATLGEALTLLQDPNGDEKK